MKVFWNIGRNKQNTNQTTEETSFQPKHDSLEDVPDDALFPTALIDFLTNSVQLRRDIAHDKKYAVHADFLDQFGAEKRIGYSLNIIRLASQGIIRGKTQGDNEQLFAYAQRSGIIGEHETQIYIANDCDNNFLGCAIWALDSILQRINIVGHIDGLLAKQREDAGQITAYLGATVLPELLSYFSPEIDLTSLDPNADLPNDIWQASEAQQRQLMQERQQEYDETNRRENHRKNVEAERRKAQEEEAAREATERRLQEEAERKAESKRKEEAEKTKVSEGNPNVPRSSVRPEDATRAVKLSEPEKLAHDINERVRGTFKAGKSIEDAENTNFLRPPLYSGIGAQANIIKNDDGSFYFEITEEPKTGTLAQKMGLQQGHRIYFNKDELEGVSQDKKIANAINSIRNLQFESINSIAILDVDSDSSQDKNSEVEEVDTVLLQFVKCFSSNDRQFFQYNEFDHSQSFQKINFDQAQAQFDPESKNTPARSR